MNRLIKLRQEIDEIDNVIEKLLLQRFEVVKKIGEEKGRQRLPLLDVDREKAIYKKLRLSTNDPLALELVHNIYQTIMEQSKYLQGLREEPSCPYKKVGIIGKGLIGGSIEKCLTARKGVETIITNAVDDVIDKVDLIILATPIDTVTSIAREIKEKVTKSTTVIDVASVKGEIAKVFEAATNEVIDFVATHPMAGSEKSGYEHSRATLFVGAPWIIVPHKHNRSLDDVKRLICCFGGRPMIMDGDKHDRQVALVSHLPKRISSAYLKFVEEYDPESLTIAGPGFASFTRLAKGNPILIKQIEKTNAENIKKIYDAWLNL